jgi:2'-5' RNA ligase
MAGAALRALVGEVGPRTMRCRRGERAAAEQELLDGAARVRGDHLTTMAGGTLGGREPEVLKSGDGGTESSMALAICLLLDPPADDAIRRLWARMEDAGVPSLQSHTHGRHVPHLTYAALRSWDLGAVSASLDALPEQPPMRILLDGLGMFRRSRCWLAPALTPDLGPRQQAVARAVTATGADLHKHYRPGEWVPHVTLAPRLHLRDLQVVARLVNDVLPVTATASVAKLIDTSTGDRHAVRHLV